MLKQRVTHYHQWLCCTIHLETKISQSSPDSLWIQGPSKRSSSGCLYLVSSVNERNRKGGKCKISRVLQSPVSSPQASPKVEASDTPQHAQHLPTYRKVQNGNSRVHQSLCDSRGMGVVDRPVRHLSSHPHPQKLKMFGISGPEKVQGPVPKPNSVGCYRQLNSSSLHKQTRRKLLGGDVCSPVENHDLVLSLPDNS